MFIAPIKPQPIRSMDELRSFSYLTDRVAHDSFIFCQNNGQIAFSDTFCRIWVTPYRNDVRKILESVGYLQQTFFVPFSNGEERPEAYKWLVKIADEEEWAETYAMAFEIASQDKGIKPVTLKPKVHIKQIVDYYEDESHTSYYPMVLKSFQHHSEQNIGTYIMIDEKNVLLCDEYGRTFLVTAKTVINDVINLLIEAGYTRTTHPENYVKKVELQEKD